VNELPAGFAELRRADSRVPRKDLRGRAQIRQSLGKVPGKHAPHQFGDVDR
jgi:hypothetical protein